MARFKYTTGNILLDDSQALVNPVNCVGAMGRGLALQFKLTYPQMFEDYKSFCQEERLKPGTLHTYRVNHHRWIVNLPTKRHWQNPSSLEDVTQGLFALRDWLAESVITSVAIPPLGCGLGGLDWSVVKPLIKDVLSPIPHIQITLYEPVKEENV